MLENLRCERDDLHVILGAELASDRAENAGTLGVAVFTNDDDRVGIKTEIAAVGTAQRGLRANDDGLDDLTLLYGGIGAALFDVDGDDITHVGIAGRVTD